MSEPDTARCHRAWLLLGLFAGLSLPAIASVGSLPETDRELSRQVDRRLRQDPVLATYRIRVSAEDGEVRLSGRVPSLAMRREAIRLTASERGVLAVEPELELSDPDLSDRTLDLRIDGALRRYSDMLPPRLTVEVVDGTAHASGDVGSIGRYLFLRETLEKTRGVRGVDLGGVRIETRRVARLDDEGLRIAMLNLLRREEFPVSGAVDVELRDGLFVLTGVVPRLIDKMEANEVIALVVDDDRIHDELRINPTHGRLRLHDGVPADMRREP